MALQAFVGALVLTTSLPNWDQAPKNTNGVERVNGLSKSTGNSPPLYVAMQSPYEKDKVFAASCS